MESCFNMALAQNIAKHVYFGLSVKETCILLGITPEGRTALLADTRYVRVMLAARVKAKLRLLEGLYDIASNAKHMDAASTARHLLAARFGVVHNARDLKQAERHHKDNMKHKEAMLKQWADFKAAALVSQATYQQLEQWTDSPAKST